jgi:hypothetical protein
MIQDEVVARNHVREEEVAAPNRGAEAEMKMVMLLKKKQD